MLFNLDLIIKAFCNSLGDVLVVLNELSNNNSCNSNSWPTKLFTLTRRFVKDFTWFKFKTSKNVSGFPSTLEKSLLISSTVRTLLLSHLTKSTSLIFLNSTNFEELLRGSLSLDKSIFLTTSTLLSSIMFIVIDVVDVDPIPTLDDDENSVSAKFFNPEVWSISLTGVSNLFHGISLLIEYDKFWK